MNIFRIFVTFFLLSVPILLLANNIAIANTTLTGNNKTDKYVQVKFDISWDNSWRTSSAPNNWDAAWVFVKYKERASGLWKHAKLHNTGHVAPSGSTITPGLVDVSASFNASTNPAVGAFIYRSADGTGTFSLVDLELRWNYGENGLTKAEYAEVEEVKVFAIEMVYVPQGAFYLGSGGAVLNGSNFGSTTIGDAGSFKVGGSTNTPYQVTSENAINIVNTSGNLFGTSLNQTGSLANASILESGVTSAVLPAGFPKGYQAFYCMKHELNQQMYVDYLNTLTIYQQSFALPGLIKNAGYSVFAVANATSPSARNGIRTSATLPLNNASLTFYCDLNNNEVGGEYDDGMFGAANFIDPYKACAFLDWSGLRPYTELEYEKACRGTVNPVGGEFPFGSGSGAARSNDSPITDAGTKDELPISTANMNYNGFVNYKNELRVGSFARATTNRTSAGATYYGILDMGGNLAEGVVVVSSGDDGREFEGNHGDGTLISYSALKSPATDQNLLYDVLTWPDFLGFGIRGASLMSTIGRVRVSDRGDTRNFPSGFTAGCRGVRTAP
ncbi:MAG: hypothetical protein LW630_09185 [Saprospiraceae bacterium]|jgi:formylglycine-generating enzyme required for sulfatase activity|nr:hypothetical protein [Saprospiraceae bacterium]